ncbi:cupin domain-containing protein [Sphingomonas sp. ERG5]|uniref:cupin domain-containing protein n=1 Tax=Sphingomonas sp. ERG5 TaxID=1381597 RepID=UPI00054BBFE1|nr:cupin domain-containing protein [Sphingomonas sp. ERG5]
MTANFLPVEIDRVTPVIIGPGCLRRDLPSRVGVRIWVVDMAPGAHWPYVDHHDVQGEDILVVSGELIEDEQRFGPGTFLHFGPDSSHRPQTKTGVRLFGFNLHLPSGRG